MVRNLSNDKERKIIMTRDELLEKLDAAQTNEEIKELGEELLELEPESPYGKLAVWETMSYEDGIDNLYLLRDALDSIRAIVDAKDNPAIIDEDRDALAYCTIMMNLGYALLSEGEIQEAYDIAKEFANFDDEGTFPSRTLLYRCMLDLGLYNEILETLENDSVESVAGGHARAIAMLEIGAEAGEVRDAVNYAISLSPDVPFFVLSIWEFPDPEEDLEEEMEEIVDDAAYVAEPWCKSDKRLAALSAPTFLFGYLTGRLDDQKEIDMLRSGYEEAGVADRIEKFKKHLEDMENNGKDPDEIDSDALGETAEILEILMGK